MFNKEIWTGTEVPAMYSILLFVLAWSEHIRPGVFAFVCFVLGVNLGICFTARLGEKQNREAFGDSLR